MCKHILLYFLGGNVAVANDKVKRYVNPLLKYCAAKIRSKHDRLDIVQDVLYDYIKVDIIFFDEKHEKNWLYKVCDNKIADYLREKYKRNDFEIPEELVAKKITTSDELQHEMIFLLEKISKLPENQEQAIKMYYLEDYTTEEIAEYLKVTQETVWNLLSKARESLR